MKRPYITPTVPQTVAQKRNVAILRIQLDDKDEVNQASRGFSAAAELIVLIISTK